MVSRPTAAGLFTDSWSPQESRPWSSEGEMGSFSWSRKGPASSVLAVFSGVTKGDRKGVMKATRGVIEDLSCLGLPGGHAHGREGLLLQSQAATVVQHARLIQRQPEQLIPHQFHDPAAERRAQANAQRCQDKAAAGQIHHTGKLARAQGPHDAKIPALQGLVQQHI